jgi:hypothetical protein
MVFVCSAFVLFPSLHGKCSNTSGAEATRCTTLFYRRTSRDSFCGRRGGRGRLGGAEKSFALLLRKITAPQVVSPNIESDF